MDRLLREPFLASALPDSLACPPSPLRPSPPVGDTMDALRSLSFDFSFAELLASISGINTAEEEMDTRLEQYLQGWDYPGNGTDSRSPAIKPVRISSSAISAAVDHAQYIELFNCIENSARKVAGRDAGLAGLRKIPAGADAIRDRSRVR